MIFALWGVFFSWSGCGAALAATGDGSLTDSNIKYVGRWDKSNSTMYRSHWGGAYLTTKFTGTTVKVNFASPTTFRFIIDGKLAIDWAWGTSTTIDLTPTPLASGTHTLKIIADINAGELPFKGLVLDPGASTVAPDSRPLVEFIGDSITAGHSTSQGPVTDYAWVTGELLGAEHTQIAYSSITLADGHHYPELNWPGMESIYFKLRAVNNCADEACAGNPAWNFSNYTAKVVVVNLGTNDQNLGANSTTPADFQSRYTAFLKNIRAKYPNADIFAMRTFNGYYMDETKAAVNARVSAGDAKVRFIDTTGWLQSPTHFADYFHPNDAGHQKAAEYLRPILQPYLSEGATVNDTQFSYDSSSNWGYGSQSGAYEGDNHWSGTANTYYQVPFNGTQVKLYGGRAPWHGIAAVSVDGGAETNVDTYAASRADNVLLWSSPVLVTGSHTLKVRVTGTKNTNSTNSYITADRVDIVNGVVSNPVSNPGFENGLSGWSVWPVGAPQAYSETGSSNSGTAHLTHWSAKPYDVVTYQALTGLSNGLYTIKAWVRGSGGQQLYVKNYGAAQMNATLPASNGYTQVVISNVNVTNNSAEIGFWSNDTSGNSWFHADDVTFHKQ